MTVNQHNPAYDDRFLDWQQMRDTHEGQRKVKEEGTKYLFLTAGMIADGALESSESAGMAAYNSYRGRAVCPELVREAVESLLGVMHRKPATIELPETMEFLRDDVTVEGESLQMLLRRINEEQLTSGRAGLLADVAESGARKDQPYLSIYFGEKIINWDEGRVDGIQVENLNLVVLDETENERTQGFNWENVEKYRVLMLTADESPESINAATGGTIGVPVENIPEGQGVYQAGVIRVAKGGGADFDAEEMKPLQLRGQTLDEIPFVFVNGKDIVADPDVPPLLGLSNLVLTIYRGEADYRQSLFMQGQDTLVVIGGDEDDEQRVGAGAILHIPNSDSADAKFIGVESQGLTEQREALENDYERAGSMGARLLDSVSGSQQSGDALRIRVAAKTATVNQVALAGAFGLQAILRIVAKWMGADPAAVVVTPNLDFADDQMPAKELIELISAKQLGAPIAVETIHARMAERGMTGLTFDDEIRAIEGERDLDLGAAPSEEGSPEPDDDPVDDE